MNKKPIMNGLVALLLSLIALEPFATAQTYPAGGKATISITSGGIKTGEVILPDQLPGQFSARVDGEGDGLMTEVAFSRSFNKPDGSATYFWVDIKAFLAATGTFPLLLVNEPNNKPYANIDVQYQITDSKGVMTTSASLHSGPHDGVHGSVTISKHTQAGHTIIQGSYSATLFDEKMGLVDVAGTFEVKQQ